VSRKSRFSLKSKSPTHYSGLQQCQLATGFVCLSLWHTVIHMRANGFLLLRDWNYYRAS